MNLSNLQDEQVDMLLNGLDLLIKNYDFKGYTITDVGKIAGLAALIIQARNKQVSSTTMARTAIDIVKRDRLGLTEEEEQAGLGSKG